VSIETHQLLMFIAAGWLLNLTPGPDVLYIVSNALRSGTRAGIVASASHCACGAPTSSAAAVGVGARMATSATAFTVLKWLGAAYLLWMGVRMLFSRAGGGNGAAIAAAQAAPQQAVSLRGVFLGGFWTNVLNPKVALFFLAFVPQFISADASHKGLAFLVLGLVFDLNGMLWCLSLAAFTAGASRRIRVPASWVAALNRSIGMLFLLFGLRLALDETR